MIYQPPGLNVEINMIETQDSSQGVDNTQMVPNTQ